jgi:predicted phage terminase large subunit-like protein
MGRYPDGRYIIQDCESDALSPHKVKIMLKRLAQHDGQRCRISIPQDPAQAGKAQAKELIAFLAGYNVKAIPRNRSTGNKLAWASPFSAQVEAGNVDVLRGPWNEAFFNILENFPEGGKDDEVDAAADAFHMLSTNNRELKIA